MLLDISHARIVHLEWEVKLEEILVSGNRKNVEISSHNECILGSWLYTEGITKYKHFPEVMRLEKIHTTFHSLAKQCVREHIHRQDASAEETLQEVKAVSREIIYLLTMIELKILNYKKKIEVVRHPIRTLFRLFR